MTDDLTIWLAFYSTLKTESLVPAVPRMLDRANAQDGDLDVVAMLDGLLSRYKAEAAAAT